jgi:hypothetical protein
LIALPQNHLWRLRIFSLAISVFTFLWMLGLKINRGTPFIETPLPLIVVVTFMIAMMCILLGLLADDYSDLL